MLDVNKTHTVSEIPEILETLSLRMIVGLLSGLTLLLVLTYVLWLLGFEISRFHWIAFLLGLFVGAVGAPLKILKPYLMVSFLVLVLFYVWAIVCGSLYGLNWDGMLGHKEYVMALEGGWNPIEDPFYENPLGRDGWEKSATSWKIEWGGYNIRFGYIYQAVIAKALGSLEAGKASNFIFLLLPFWVSLYVLSRFKVGFYKRFLLSIMIAFNPVWIMQALSYWEDAHFAGIAVVCLLLSILIAKEWRWIDLALLVCSMILMVGAKRSGLAFSGTLIGMAVFIRFLRSPLSRKTWGNLFIAGSVICSVFAIGVLLGIWKTHGLFPYKLEQILSVSRMDHLFDETLLSKVPHLASLSGPFQFFAAVLSEGTMVPTDISLKIPFSFTQKEFDLYYHIFTAPWFGGFGPWYGISLFLLFGIFCWNLPSLLRGNLMFRTCWPWIVFLLGILWLMPPFYPRWIPFLWVLPMLLYLPLEMGFRSTQTASDNGRRNSLSRVSLFDIRMGTITWVFLSRMLIFVLLLNSSTLLCLNIAGHVRSSAVIREQLEFIQKRLPEPVTVCFVDFASNRDWLDSAGIEWVFDPYGWQADNYMILGRTNTYVLLNEVDPDEAFTVGGKQWESIYEWRDSMNQRLGRRPEWNAWIRDTIVIKKR